MALVWVVSILLLLQVTGTYCRPLLKDFPLRGNNVCSNCSSADNQATTENHERQNVEGGEGLYIGDGIVARYWLPDNKVVHEIAFDAKLYKSYGFLSERSTKIIFPGWYFDASYWQMLVDAYFNSGSTSGYNVIVLDYQSPINLNYHMAVLALPEVAEPIAKLIDFLVREVGADLKGIHLIGHCIGAHLAGYVANAVTVGYIPRITGLDPIKEDFEYADYSQRLDPSDAGFVDIFHTNSLKLGMGGRAGDVDFFVDLGTWQSKCVLESPVVTKYSGRCSHLKAWNYYQVSITNSKCMMAYPCSGVWNYENVRDAYCKPIGRMGEHILEQDTVYMGNYYIKISYWWDASWNPQCFWLWFKIFG